METNNMNTRARFEEIWPVPDSVFWSEALGKYCAEHDRDYIISSARKHNEYLDIFTRCQETTDVYVSLVDEMVKELESCYGQLRMAIAGELDRFYVSPVLERAKQIMGDKK